MPINTSGLTPNTIQPANPQPAQKTVSGSFSETLKSVSGTKAPPSLSSPTDKDIGDLAKAVANNKLSKEDAGRQFVGMMVKRHFDNKLCEKSQKIIEDALSNVLTQDPNFASRLDAQLKKLG